MSKYGRAVHNINEYVSDTVSGLDPAVHAQFMAWWCCARVSGRQIAAHCALDGRAEVGLCPRLRPLRPHRLIPDPRPTEDRQVLHDQGAWFHLLSRDPRWERDFPDGECWGARGLM